MIYPLRGLLHPLKTRCIRPWGNIFILFIILDLLSFVGTAQIVLYLKLIIFPLDKNIHFRYRHTFFFYGKI